MEGRNKAAKNGDILCFRHARSEFNEGEESFYRQEPNKSYKEFEGQTDFSSVVLYNPKYIDARLSKVGIQQCEKAKFNAELKRVKVVLVSPLMRALQTANLVFGDLGIPIIVRPELTESYRYSCDISIPMQEKQKLFPKTDFQHVSGFG